MSASDDMPNEPISFAEKFVHSDQFKTVFQEGMDLVERTASYLDGEGRQQARELPHPVALAYATESMRLTTRLMQLASWLLIHRAVKEGEITPQQALEDSNRVRLKVDENRKPSEGYEDLPESLLALIDESRRLQHRISRLDELTANSAPAEPTASPLDMQLDRLQSAFSKK